MDGEPIEVVDSNPLPALPGVALVSAFSTVWICLTPIFVIVVSLSFLGRLELARIVVPAVTLAIFLVVFAGFFLRVRSRRYEIYDDEIVLSAGAISRGSETTGLDQMDEVTYEQTDLQARFGVGTITVSDTDVAGTQTKLKHVEAPGRVSETIQSLIEDDDRPPGDRADATPS